MILDIIVGSILAMMVDRFANGEERLLLLGFGIFSTLAPDIDFLVYLWKNKGKVDQFAHEHRDLLHHPLPFSIGGGIILSYFIAWPYVTLWVLGTLWHFVHDTYEGGWGIRWIPRDPRYFTLASYSPAKIIQNKAEQHTIAERDGNPNWFKGELSVSARDRWLLAASLVLLYIWIW